MNTKDPHEFPPEAKAALERMAQGHGESAVYARMQLAILPALRRAVADEMALNTQPNNLAVALGSLFGFATVELVGKHTDNPGHMAGRVFGAMHEQVVNMTVSFALDYSKAKATIIGANGGKLS